MTMRAYLGRLYARFPIPLTMRELTAARQGPRVLANSIPKAGTNLLIRALKFMPQMAPRWSQHVDNNTPRLNARIAGIRRGQWLSAHVYWNPELAEIVRAQGIRALLIVRDLRDVAWSNVHFLTNVDPKHRLHNYFKALPSDDERLMASIVGIAGDRLPDGVPSKSIGEHANSYLPWIKDPSCLLVRFEDLVGAAGGGSTERQHETIRAISRHLGIALSEPQVAGIAAKLYSQNVWTFRKGTIGDWANHFSEAHKRAFKEVAGEALIKFGYAENNDW